MIKVYFYRAMAHCAGASSFLLTSVEEKFFHDPRVRRTHHCHQGRTRHFKSGGWIAPLLLVSLGRPPLLTWVDAIFPSHGLIFGQWTSSDEKVRPLFRPIG